MVPPLLCRCLGGPMKLLFRGSLPKADGIFCAAALEEPEAASIVRDEAGVPHIRANTDHDVFFLNGVVHAQDRLWQIHSTRMLAAGRLCEIAGAKALEIDRLSRQLGFRHLAHGDLEAVQDCDLPEAADALIMAEAFAAGVNWAVEHATRGGKLPIEFKLTGQKWEPWQVVDTLSLARVYGFVMNFGFQHSLLRQGLIELFGADKAAAWTSTVEQESTIPHVVDEAMWQAFRAANLAGVFNSATDALPRGQGSNWWTIHGSRTTTGKPILVGDPHLSIKVPGFWYEAHLEQTGGGSSIDGRRQLKAYGVAPPGIPGILIGQNGFFANSITLAYCHVEDVFLERFRKSDGRYLHRGVWEECEVRKETIVIKGAPSEECICRSTCHGVVLDGKTLMQFDPFKRAATEGDKVMEGEEIQVVYAGIPLRAQSLSLVSLAQCLRARSFAEYDQALRHISTTYSLNFGYADVDGHIGYILIGEVPRRASKPGVELLPLAGWTGENDWVGFVTHAELAKAYDPPSGMIICANHKIIDNRDYPHYLGQTWKSGYRAQAIQHELQRLLEGGRKISPTQMPEVLMNVKSWAAVEFVKEVSDVVPEPDVEAAFGILKAWDGYLSEDSIAASIYQLTHAELVRLLFDRGCRSLNLTPAKGVWAGLEPHALSNIVQGESFDPAGMLKIVNEFHGHLHLNVLRLLRAARSTTPSCPADAGRQWWLQQAGGRDVAINAALRSACSELERRGGKAWQSSKKASWGQVHMAHFIHPISKSMGLPPGSPPFDIPSCASGGDTNTIMQAAPKSLTDLTATSAHVSLRVIFNLADLDDEKTNRIISPLGQSGQFHSRHYGDQNELWRSGGLRPMATRAHVVQAGATGTMRFQRAPVRSGSALGCFARALCCRSQA